MSLLPSSLTWLLLDLSSSLAMCRLAGSGPVDLSIRLLKQGTLLFPERVMCVYVCIRVRERMNQNGATVLYNLISEVTCIYFCHTLAHTNQLGNNVGVSYCSVWVAGGRDPQAILELATVIAVDTVQGSVWSHSGESSLISTLK